MPPDSGRRKANLKQLECEAVVTKTRWGDVIILATARGVAGAGFPGEPQEAVLSRIAKRRGAGLKISPGASNGNAQKAAAFLLASIEGKRPAEAMPIDWDLKSFSGRVWRALLRVPFGARITYSALAMEAGFPKAIRATALANRQVIAPVFIPNHRVVSQSGELVISANDPWTPVREFLYQSERVEIPAGTGRGARGRGGKSSKDSESGQN